MILFCTVCGARALHVNELLQHYEAQADLERSRMVTKAADALQMLRRAADPMPHQWGLRMLQSGGGSATVGVRLP